MTSAPLPSRNTLRPPAPDDLCSCFPPPPPPTSQGQFFKSTVAPAGPSNSSLQTKVQAAGVGVGEGVVAGGGAGMSVAPQAVVADRRRATRHARGRPISRERTRQGTAEQAGRGVAEAD